MINNFLQITATHKFDFITIFSLTVPVFIGFIIFTTIYFFKIDKMNSSQANYYKSHGLSRFCLAGIFFLFGLIIFDLNFEFILGYLTQYINTDNFNTYTISKLENSILFKSLTSVYKTIPINILINFTIICTAIYTSTEGIIASLKTLKVEPGLSVELPLLKRQRLSSMFLLWCYIAIIATIYNILIGSDVVTFPIKNIYISTGLTLVILFLAERSPSLLQDTSISSKLVKTANNVVSTDTETYLDADKAWNGVNDEIYGDKVSLEDVKKVVKTVVDEEETMVSGKEDIIGDK